MKRDLPSAHSVADAIVDFIQSTPKVWRTCYSLAKKFGVDSSELRPVLEKLAASGVLNKVVEQRKGQLYGAPRAIYVKKEEKRTGSESIELAPRVWKEYKQGTEWDYVNERLREFRSIKSKY